MNAKGHGRVCVCVPACIYLYMPWKALFMPSLLLLLKKRQRILQLCCNSCWIFMCFLLLLLLLLPLLLPRLPFFLGAPNFFLSFFSSSSSTSSTFSSFLHVLYSLLVFTDRNFLTLSLTDIKRRKEKSTGRRSYWRRGRGRDREKEKRDPDRYTFQSMLILSLCVWLPDGILCKMGAKMLSLLWILLQFFAEHKCFMAL